ncbi:hypothetical protein GCK72_011937 [Caenorhabditis remanei]|uniref:Uncharacterized protein n=1 Tax=Caenorhabditis remanei TaxID=31234 RepID=A0A6A5GJL2_CAERE|nr:hypothetical protein GCK72_011937 [Caenorhabditis remanei]KAF1755487.1 hypothetical protein GCK72_011937 [Caenorhabditis remanei]
MVPLLVAITTSTAIANNPRIANSLPTPDIASTATSTCLTTIDRRFLQNAASEDRQTDDSNEQEEATRSEEDVHTKKETHFTGKQIFCEH